MKKAIIVIDMPKRCKDCFRYQADAWFGGSCRQVKEENGWNKKLKPMKNTMFKIGVR